MMNNFSKRAFEIAKQVDLIQWDTLPSGARTPDHESVAKVQEFAKLIVLECAAICNKQSLFYSETNNRGSAASAADTCRFLIKLHFGVE